MYHFLIYLALFILVFILALCVFNTLLPVPFIPTSKKTARKMVEAANLKETDSVYDLGSGDGRLILMAAEKGVKSAVGFEINPFLNMLARLKAKILKRKNTLFITQSVFAADLSKCDKLFIYMSTKIMKKLESKIMNEMKDGALVISNTFPFYDMKPIQVIDNKIKIYRIQK
jgi:16S rRNA A1518/A1519 N6-dimethyltransferase RsmA/KsgA/DIM1 with predicted DNA glycosylase/AP lyase activity